MRQSSGGSRRSSTASRASSDHLDPWAALEDEEYSQEYDDDDNEDLPTYEESVGSGSARVSSIGSRYSTSQSRHSHASNKGDRGTLSPSNLGGMRSPKLSPLCPSRLSNDVRSKMKESNRRLSSLLPTPRATQNARGALSHSRRSLSPAPNTGINGTSGITSTTVRRRSGRPSVSTSRASISSRTSLVPNQEEDNYNDSFNSPCMKIRVVAPSAPSTAQKTRESLLGGLTSMFSLDLKAPPGTSEARSKRRESLGFNSYSTHSTASALTSSSSTSSSNGTSNGTASSSSRASSSGAGSSSSPSRTFEQLQSRRQTMSNHDHASSGPSMDPPVLSGGPRQRLGSVGNSNLSNANGSNGSGRRASALPRYGYTTATTTAGREYKFDENVRDANDENDSSRARASSHNANAGTGISRRRLSTSTGIGGGAAVSVPVKPPKRSSIDSLSLQSMHSNPPPPPPPKGRKLSLSRGSYVSSPLREREKTKVIGVGAAAEIAEIAEIVGIVGSSADTDTADLDLDRSIDLLDMSLDDAILGGRVSVGGRSRRQRRSTGIED